TTSQATERLASVARAISASRWPRREAGFVMTTARWIRAESEPERVRQREAELARRAHEVDEVLRRVAAAVRRARIVRQRHRQSRIESILGLGADVVARVEALARRERAEARVHAQKDVPEMLLGAHGRVVEIRREASRVEAGASRGLRCGRSELELDQVE